MQCTIAYQTSEGDSVNPIRCVFLEHNLHIVPSDDAGPARMHPSVSAPYNQVYLFRAGGAQLTTAYETITFVPGTIYVIPPHLPGTIAYPAGTELLWFHASVVDAIGFDLFHGVQHILACTDPLLAQAIDAGFTGTGPTDVFRWQSALFAALSRLALPILSATWAREIQAVRYRDLMSLCETRPPASVSVNWLAEQLRQPRGSLSRAFCRDMGMPLKQFLTHRVLQRACELLASTDLTVLQVADTLGYEDPYYFHRVFRKQMGQTPLQYRHAARMAGRAQVWHG